MESLTFFPRWKRVLDLTCILLTLPFWMLIMVCVSIWIKLVSRGPILYKQERVGLGEGSFMILKFRSMHCGAPTEVHENHVRDLIQSNKPLEKLDGCDHRLIPLGRFIRALGLDELPQLINVLRGDMSLVGPRPCTFPEFEVFGAKERERVQVPPGLTGIWQVSGKNKLTFSKMIDLDLEYAKTMSLAQDLRIMARTVPALYVQVQDLRQKRRIAKLQAKEQGKVVGVHTKAVIEKKSQHGSGRAITGVFSESTCLPSLGSGIRKL